MKRHTYRIEGKFDFEAGGSVSSLEVAYHTSPMDYHKGMKTIWICHALTSDSNAEDWWPELVGPGKLFDTEKYFVVCGNMLGSCYGSSGPSSIDPETGKPYYFSFPKVTVRDIVNALDAVREHIGIGHIDLLVGASIGGFQALEWSVKCPDLFTKAVYIATSSRISPWITAFEESQRMALEADPTFRACESLDGGKRASNVPEPSHCFRTDAKTATISSSRSLPTTRCLQTEPVHITGIRGTSSRKSSMRTRIITCR